MSPNARLGLNYLTLNPLQMNALDRDIEEFLVVSSQAEKVN